MLALQGDFEAHATRSDARRRRAVEVRSAADLEDVDGLVIPGGESTTMMKLLEEEKLLDPLREFGREHPIFGTCAGAILLASGRGAIRRRRSLGLMDIDVERNAYGRQLDSRIARLATARNRRRAGGGVHSRAHHSTRRPGRESAGQLSGRSGAGGTRPASGGYFSSRAHG